MKLALLAAFLVHSQAYASQSYAVEHASTARGDHFEVVCDFERSEVAEEALRSVEAVWPLAVELFGLDAGRLDEPLRVHLYRTRAGYDRADRRLTGGVFEKNQAFSHWDTRTSHVAMQPAISDENLAVLGLPSLTRRMLIHEAAHLARFTAFPSYRSHPDWLVHGFATWADRQVMEALGMASAGEHDPETSTSIASGQRLIERDALPDPESILRGEIVELAFMDEYGVTGLFFGFLAADDSRERLIELLAEVRGLEGGQAFADELLQLVFARIGKGRKLAALGNAFERHLTSLEPRWEQVYRLLDTVGDEWVQQAFPDTNAIAWRTQSVGKKAYTVSGSLRILPGGTEQLNVLLDRGRARTGNETFVSVAFFVGGVTAFLYDAEGDQEWQRLGNTSIPELTLETDVAFEVSVDGSTVSIAVAGTPRLTVTAEGRALDGPFGLGAQRGTAGIWKDVRVD